MCVNSNLNLIGKLCNNICNSFTAFVNHKAAFCFAKTEYLCSTINGSLQSLECIFFILFVCCKKVFGIVENCASVLF